MKSPSTPEKELLQQHAALVTAAVQQFAQAVPHQFSPEHLHSLGLIALLDAVRSYPAASPIPFESFARIQIHSALMGEVHRANRWFAPVNSVANPTPATV